MWSVRKCIGAVSAGVAGAVVGMGLTIYTDWAMGDRVAHGRFLRRVSAMVKRPATFVHEVILAVKRDLDDLREAEREAAEMAEASAA